MYGPFWHKLNKGGLTEILATQRLRSTVARGIAGGGEAVRAHVGSYADDPLFTSTPGQAIIEFRTDTAPRKDTPPWLAEWRIPEGEYLSIRIVKLYRPGGSLESY